MSRKWVSGMGAVGLAVTVVALAGCGATSSTAKGAGGPGNKSTAATKTMDFANFSDSGALFQGLQNGLVSAAKEAGFKMDTYNNNDSGSTTLSNAHLMALNKPYAVLEYNPISDAGTRLGQVFNQSNTACVAVNIPFPGCAWFNQSDSALADQLAVVMAKLMKQRGWDGSNTTAVLLINPTAGPAVNIGIWDDYAALAKAVPGMTQKSASSFTAQTTKIGQTGLQVNAGNTLNSAYTAMQQALETIPANRNIVVFSIDDDLTVGAYRALKQANRANRAMVTGFGGDSQALAALRSNPSWVAEEDSFFTNWGEYLLALAVALHHGVKPPHLTLSPEAILTKANVNNYYAPGSSEPKQLPAVPPQDSFLLKTGVLQKFGNIKGVSK